MPVSTLRALEASESVGLHLMMGNGVAITIANGAGLKNQPAINLSSKVETTRNSKTISFASNTRLYTCQYQRMLRKLSCIITLTDMHISLEL